jgi:hypothetical protein
MYIRLLAASVCAFALTACDIEKRPDSAPDQGGASATRTSPGAAPATPSGSGASAGSSSSTGGGSTRP